MKTQLLNRHPPTASSYFPSIFCIFKELSLSLSQSFSEQNIAIPMSTSRTNAPANSNPNNSYEVPQPPGDSVSSINFSPNANFLVATSWDNQVRCLEILRDGKVLGSKPMASFSHDQPVLCSAWKDDGTTVFSGGCDKQVIMWPLTSGAQPTIVATHDAPIKDIAWIQEKNVLVTGSWDKTIKHWDIRQANPFHTQQLPNRCYALAVRYPLMVVGTADGNLIVFNLRNPQIEFMTIKSPLTYQTRCIAAFPDMKGLVVGSIEGKFAIQNFDNLQENFSLKCHRDGNEIYSVNSVNFHPVHHHILSTSGSDGTFNFWDLKKREPLTVMERYNQPIPCSAFNNDGSMFAYSLCYDWSKGAENHNPATAQTHIFIHLPELFGLHQEDDNKGNRKGRGKLAPGKHRLQSK